MGRIFPFRDGGRSIAECLLTQPFRKRLRAVFILWQFFHRRHFTFFHCILKYLIFRIFAPTLTPLFSRVTGEAHRSLSLFFEEM